MDCVNCSQPIDDSFKFCPNCSQKTQLKRLSLKDIVHDAFHYFTHADKGILQLIKELTLRTGRVAREFVWGKRKKYFPPLNFYLIVATISVLAAGFYNRGATVDVIRAIPKSKGSTPKGRR